MTAHRAASRIKVVSMGCVRKRTIVVKYDQRMVSFDAINSTAASRIDNSEAIERERPHSHTWQEPSY
jgi:hypothetical protein